MGERVELITQYAWVGPAVVILLAIALTLALRSRRRALSSVVEITQELKALAAEQPRGRLEASGRHEEVGTLILHVTEEILATALEHLHADLAQSVNALLDGGAVPLVESQQLFGTLTSLLPELALVHTDVILYANSAAAAHFGLEPDALVGKAIVDLVRPAYRSVLRDHVATLQEDGAASADPGDSNAGSASRAARAAGSIL